MGINMAGTLNMAIANKKASASMLKGLFIWSLATIFYFFDNLLNVAPAAIQAQLTLEFSLNAAKLGILMSCYAWPYALMQIPVGILMDKYGPRRLLTLACLSCTIGTLIFANANIFATACLGRLFIGFGASFAVVGCAKISTIWFSSDKFATFMGIMVAVGMFGAAAGLSSVRELFTLFGWRFTMSIAAVFSLFLSALLWISIVDNKPNTKTKDNQQQTSKLMDGLKIIMSNSQSWYTVIYAGLMFVPTMAFGALWGVPFMEKSFGFSEHSAGILNSMIFYGWIVGGPLWGWFSDYIKKRNLPMLWTNFATLLLTISVIYGKHLGMPISFTSLATQMFLIGFFSSGFVVAFAVVKELNPAKIAGTAVGFTNTINTLSIAIFQWLIGSIIDYVQVGSEPVAADFEKALIAVPICLIISILVILLVKETNCTSMES
jgi:predicted MFS family arabinose efflux permease